VICTELCGLGHAVMRSEAVVMEPAAFDKWLDEQTKKLETGGPSAGKAVFVNNGCGACHTLKAGGGTGKIGPDLDKLPEEAARAGQSVEEFVHESIVDPNKYVEPGFPKSVMPQDYEKAIPPKQLDDLVEFLVESTKEPK
jgi:cytochrome c oxidase subunit 2